MVEYIYVKTILSVEKFNAYIVGSFTINGVSYYEDKRELVIYFATSLSTIDKATLDTLVEAYSDPVDNIRYLHKYVNTSVINTEETEWKFICSWIESGDELLANILVRCKLLPATPDDSMDTGFEYYIRVLDVTNNTILGQITMTNSEYDQGTLPITGLPTSECVLEFQVKKSAKGSRVSVSNIKCNYM